MRLARMIMLVVLSVTLGAIAFSGTANAQDTGDYVGSQPPSGGASVSGSGTEGTRSGSSPLPVTGADITLLVVVGLAAVGTGLAMTTAARRRRGLAVR